MNQIKIRKVSSLQWSRLQLDEIPFEEILAKSDCEENYNNGEGFLKKTIDYDYIYKNSEYYLASHQNEILGYLKVNITEIQTKIQKSSALDIELICLSGENQEKKMIGIMLYDKAIKIAKQKNVEYVWVGIFSENPGAICFYRRNGFQVFDKHIFKSGDGEKVYIFLRRKVCEKGSN
jgi:ribosomal protein S18 acetylase RimI-like enzyme